MSWPWKPMDWKDPKGGVIRFFPYIPTVVLPRKLRPRDDWDGLAFLLHPEERESWEDEEKMEKSGKGSSTMLAIHGGGDLARMLIRMQLLEDVKGAKFPDPEPRRLLKLADRDNIPTYFIEPGVEDEDWLSYLEDSADEAAKLSRMFLQLFARRRFAKTWKRTQREVSEPPISEGAESLAIAAGLAATWWRVSESFSTADLQASRNLRFAGRIRGALANLSSLKEEPVLIVPIYQDWMADILATLKTNVEVEDVEADGLEE